MAMRVLKVEVEAPVCSFRYPHFLVGKQVTFPMPPPSTIYGHVASAMGGWPDPARLRFAYRFTCEGRGEDLEHQHIIWPDRGMFGSKGEYPVSVAVSIQPTRREFLFNVRLDLYLDYPDLDGLAKAFAEPRWPVVLGRSQDLACYRNIQVVELEPSPKGYYEDTLLPFRLRYRTGRGVTLYMPRYVGPPPFREATFDRFIALAGRVLDPGPDVAGGDDADVLLRLDGKDETLWVDPYSPEWRGARRALAFHRFVGEESA